jgi:hypothetical protein
VFFSFIFLEESAWLVLLALGYSLQKQEQRKASRQANEHTRKKQKNNEENRTQKHK